MEMGSKILMVCNGKTSSAAYGNMTTISRIGSYFQKRGVCCSVVNTAAVQLYEDWWEVQKQSGHKCVLAIHAWHCASVLNNCPLPFAIVFGGTDLNEYSSLEDCLEKMTDVVLRAKRLVTFCPSMTSMVLELWPQIEISSKIREIPQAAKTDPSSFDLKKHLNFIKRITAEKVFLLVAGIRPVKDPLFLVSEFSKWHKLHLSCWLVVVGNVRDEKYFCKVEKTIRASDGVVLLPEMPQGDIHACMKSSVAVVNSSVSEGMCSAILESMELGTPVIARNIPGNRDLIEHGQSGFLYETTVEFFTAAELVLENKELCQQITSAAKEKVLEKHQCEQELLAYVEIVKELVF